MIYRLQRKFILICALSIFAVILVIYGFISVLNISSLNKTLDTLTDSISSNNGREEFIPVRLLEGVAYPIFRKSGVISLLCEADGYIVIDRNKEGLKKDKEVEVRLF